MSLSSTPRNPGQGANPQLQRPLSSDRSRGSGGGKPTKRFRFEWSFLQLVTFGGGALVVMVWMFVFGVMVGRDLPLTDSDDQSLRGQFIRFMGLPHKEAKGPREPGAPADDPARLVDELDYNKALTQKSEPSPESPPAKGEAAGPKKPAAKPSTNEPAARAGAKASPHGGRPPESRDDVAGGPAVAGGEAHAVLVASLRSEENARKFQQQLRAKGYDAQLETLDKTDSGRWYRIIVGSFQSREDAQRFVAEFNKREKAQGMVIRIKP